MLKKQVPMLILIVAALLSACAGPDLDTPEGTVQEFFNRVADQDENAVEELLCTEFRDDLNFALSRGDKADLDFDLHTDIDGEYEDDEVVNVQVWGSVKTTLEKEGLKVEYKETREQDTAWTVQVFQQDGEWRVCGGNESPLILRFLDLRAQLTALE